MKQKYSCSGFTLIEVIIGMTLLSIMMVLLFGSMRVCVQNWDAGELKIREVSRMSSVQNFFKRHLTSIKPLRDEFSKEESGFSFQGGQQSMQFVSSLPVSASRFGLQLFSVGLKKNEKGDQVLSVAIKPFFPTADGEEWDVEDVVLAENVETFEIAYYGNGQQGEDSDWQSEWENPSLPKLISVRIEDEDGNVWPEIIVEPKVTSASSGLFISRKRDNELQREQR